MNKSMKAIEVPSVMMEASKYKSNPATFSRGMLCDGKLLDKILFISGTASVGPNGETLYKGDFSSQVKQMFSNITEVLSKGDMNWKNVVRTTIYLRDIDRDYEQFNKLRKEFYGSLGLNPYPASTCIGAKICRSDLLCEMEAIAIKEINEALPEV